MRLCHNMASLNIYREHTKVFNKQSTSLGRISSGFKVNSAKDNPNVIAQSEKLRMQIRGLQMASRNVQDGISMLQTAEGGLESITDSLQRMKVLIIQAGSGSNSLEDKNIIQSEINQIVESIDDFVNNTEFNGVKLLNNDKGKLKMCAGPNVGEVVDIPTYNLLTKNLGGESGKLSDIDVTKEGGIDDALNIIDVAMEQVTSARSNFGALENRFESSFQNIIEISDRIQGAESNIRDVDVAEEIIEYAKYGILIESGHAMMVQSNKFPQDMLKVLENIK